MNTQKMASKGIICFVSAASSWVIGLLGGWSTSLETLLIFMTVDYITGLLCAFVWNVSPKSRDGKFESKSSLKGLFRKGGILLIILIAARLELEISAAGNIRTTVILFFIANEGFSIIENLGIMGLPLPEFIKSSFSRLKSSDE